MRRSILISPVFCLAAVITGNILFVQTVAADTGRCDGDIAAPILYRDLMLVLVTSEGVAAVIFEPQAGVAAANEPRTSVGYRYRYQSKDGKTTKTGQGKIFEKRNVKGDISGQLLIQAGPIEVGWSPRDGVSGWIYYSPEEVRVHIGKASRFAESKEPILFTNGFQRLEPLDLRRFLK